MSPAERSSIQNIILLCVGHHKLIDREPTAKQYTVEILQSWKVEREGDYAATLNGIGVVTESKLQELIVDAVARTKDDLLSAINSLKSSNGEMVETLRSLITESFDRLYAVEDIELLHEAALRLTHLHDHAPMIHEAARNLIHLHDHAWPLHEAAIKLGNLEHMSWTLRNAVDQIQWHTLRDFSDKVGDLSSGSPRLTDHDFSSSELAATVNRLEAAIKNLDIVRSQPTMEPRQGSTTPWRFTAISERVWLTRGFIIGISFAVTIAICAAIVAINASGP
ncbi:hypothetical protein GCM10022224_034720 [Nonomuraea antimicrobica]|uniref:Uncharacterized protein n=1 Tax=Nonomuraea antimicrobica TaxID=561173 RepID=A0ABP7BQY1_9ACTN